MKSATEQVYSEEFGVKAAEDFGATKAAKDKVRSSTSSRVAALLTDDLDFFE